MQGLPPVPRPGGDEQPQQDTATFDEHVLDLTFGSPSISARRFRPGFRATLRGSDEHSVGNSAVTPPIGNIPSETCGLPIRTVRKQVIMHNDLHPVRLFW